MPYCDECVVKLKETRVSKEWSVVEFKAELLEELRAKRGSIEWKEARN